MEKSQKHGSMTASKKQSGNTRTGKYVSKGNNCNLVVKKSVTICNFPIDERNNLVYNAYKKEHRDAVAECEHGVKLSTHIRSRISKQ